jgi:hypothetical protein
MPMSLNMYEASIPAFARMLENLSQILHKAEAYAENRKIAPQVLIDARLAPDMFPLARQIQIASDSVKGAAARLTGSEIPSYPDTETSFAELQERIAKTLKFIQGFKPEQFDGSETRDILVKGRNHERRFNGRDYLFSFVIPNFFFHVTTAYAILRHNGLEIGKADYLGNIG